MHELLFHSVVISRPQAELFSLPSVAACHSLLHCPGVDLCMGGLCRVPCTRDGSHECGVGQICTAGGVCGFKCIGADNLCPQGTVCHKEKCEQTVSLI